MCEQEKSTKTPQTVDTIESFSDKNRKASYMTTFDEFDNCTMVLNTKICSKI